MASIKLAYMPQEPSLISPYLPKHGIRSKSKGDLWSNPAVNQINPAANPASASAMWGPPLPVLNNASSLSSPIPNVAPQPGAPILGNSSLASLAASSEPIAGGREAVGNPALSSPSYAHTPLAATGSRLASTQTSRSASPAPHPAALPLSAGTGPLKPAAPDAASSSHLVTNLSDEIINTAIVVKNIPFAIKKEQLIDFMTQLGLPLPYAFNYHFDNGVFRGLAFANFASAEETAAVISSLNGRELGGRRLRVEYKKMLPYQERERIEREKRERRGQLEEQHQKSEAPPLNGANSSGANSSGANSSGANLPAVASLHDPSLVPRASNRVAALSHYYSAPAIPIDFNDPEILDTYSSLLVFKHDAACPELVIPAAPAAQLAPTQTFVLQALCDRLELVIGMTDEQSLFIAKRGDRRFGDENESYLLGVLRNAVPPQPRLRPQTTPAASLKPPLTHAASPALHHPTFPSVVSGPLASATAHTSGYHRWNSVENLAGPGVGGSFAK